MWPWKSNSKNHSPKQSGDEEFKTVSALAEHVESSFAKYLDVLEAHQVDLTTINTAINRIERKQNRWLEILNDRDASSEAEKAETSPRVPAAERLTSLLAGEPTEE